MTTKLDEQSYLEGERAALRAMLSEVLRRLDVVADDPQRTIARLTKEREDTIAALRSVCREHGDNEWEPEAYLADVVDRHLGKYLAVRASVARGRDQEAPMTTDPKRLLIEPLLEFEEAVLRETGTHPAIEVVVHSALYDDLCARLVREPMRRVVLQGPTNSPAERLLVGRDIAIVPWRARRGP